MSCYFITIGNTSVLGRLQSENRQFLFHARQKSNAQATLSSKYWSVLWSVSWKIKVLLGSTSRKTQFSAGRIRSMSVSALHPGRASNLSRMARVIDSNLQKRLTSKSRNDSHETWGSARLRKLMLILQSHRKEMFIRVSLYVYFFKLIPTWFYAISY